MRTTKIYVKLTGYLEIPAKSEDRLAYYSSLANLMESETSMIREAVTAGNLTDAECLELEKNHLTAPDIGVLIENPVIQVSLEPIG